MQHSYGTRIVTSNFVPLDPALYPAQDLRREAREHYEIFVGVLKEKWPKGNFDRKRLWPTFYRFCKDSSDWPDRTPSAICESTSSAISDSSPSMDIEDIFY
jgi:hypothetical protein